MGNPPPEQHHPAQQPPATPAPPPAAGTTTPSPPRRGCLIRLWKTVVSPTRDVPPVAAASFVPEGQVYINKPGTPPPDGQKVVLRRTGSARRLELTATTPANVAEAYRQQRTTFLSPADAPALGEGQATVTVRRYRWYDSVAKLFSWTGLLVAFPAIAGAIGAVATLFGVLSPAPAEMNTHAMQAALAWAAEPLATLDANPAPAATTSAAAEFERRSLQAHACVQSLQSHHGPIPQIPGITCQPQSPSWIQDHGGQIAAGATVLITIAGLISTARQTRFRQSL